MTSEVLAARRRIALAALAAVCLAAAGTALLGAWRVRVLVDSLNVPGSSGFADQESYFEEIHRLYDLSFRLAELFAPLFVGGIAAITVLLMARAWPPPRASAWSDGSDS